MHSANIPTGDPFFIVIEMSQPGHSAFDQRSGGTLPPTSPFPSHSVPILRVLSASAPGGTRHHVGNVARPRPGRDRGIFPRPWGAGHYGKHSSPTLPRRRHSALRTRNISRLAGLICILSRRSNTRATGRARGLQQLQ
ncbi:hypothetical protein CSOJ01_11583 [Colletotrichum sojae]|uniref:Uncharacterized protein n=1 Tax=Colletotrichum sojae TaxID=2175907 RepID=A0A8H6MNM5_9PEZI|nr:hypothetical protein CSOJ01_11583 [Colletotrichum sojae]